MRITHRMIADTANINLQHSLKRLEHYSNQLSTGKIFRKPSENPVGVGRVMSYSAAVDRNEQFRLNMNQSRGWLENTEQGLLNSLEILQRARELTVYGANESLTGEDRRAIAPEILEFIDSLVGIGNTEMGGLFIFGGHQTLQRPFIRETAYRVVVDADSGIVYDPEDPAGDLIVEGLQNGNYQLMQSRETTAADIDASLTPLQQTLSGSAETIIGNATWGDVSANVNASVLLEISSVNSATGDVTYSYDSHQYTLENVYEKFTGEFTLTFGGAESQNINIGDVVVTIDGLDSAGAAGLRAGDRTVINVLPSQIAGSTYDSVAFTGNYRGEQAETTYIFNENTLDNETLTYHSFSLDTFMRSLDRGKVYDGFFSLEYDDFEATPGPALTFAYDREGFPVYQGDDYERIQEISPHQEMVMNLSGLKAFTNDLEVFAAVYDAYWALVDNDRESLGSTVLANLDDAIDHILERLAQVGARSNRLEAMHSTLSNENLYLREVRSNIEDIDLAYVITEFMMQENAYRAALSTASMMLQPSLVDYLR